jgi:hypothetical protein
MLFTFVCICNVLWNCYRWEDITNVINHKRNFGIECQLPDETVHFQFPDPESAKYVWRMCVHQVNNFLCNIVFVFRELMEKSSVSSFFPQSFVFDFC